MSRDPFFALERSGGCLQRMVAAGYERESAELLVSGGFRALSVDELVMSAELRSVYFTSLFGRLARTSDFNAIAELGIEFATQLICDSYYQHLYPAWPLGDFAIYGRIGYGPEIPDLDLPDCQPLRVRHKGVRTYFAATFEQLETVRDALSAILVDKGLLLFRGQRRQRLLNRPPAVRGLLYGSESDPLEPSLISSAHRAGVDGDELLGLLQLELQDLAYAEEDLASHTKRAAQTLSPLLALPEGAQEPELTAHKNRIAVPAVSAVREIMALAQHYGMPTYGIDLTKSLEVATWFALHRAEQGPEDRLRYERVNWSEPDRESWPCLYFFVTREGQNEQFDIPSDLVSDSLRPRCQRAFLSSGGWGWHSNAAAEQLVAAVYLGPDIAQTSTLPTTSELFPDPSTDRFYEFLLERKRRALSKPRSVFRSLYERLPEVET